MLVKFFFFLRQAGLPVSLTEFLALLDGLNHRLVTGRLDDFYRLARVALVKDESRYDLFDRAFGAFFEGVELQFGLIAGEVPEEWLKSTARKLLTDAEKAQIESLGGFDKLMETLAERLAEQKERHEGGNKWIGTGGTSPFGHGGYHPEGVRIGGKGRHGRAVNVWERRDYRNLDSDRSLGTRNLKLALRKLRRFARDGVADQFNVDDTIEATARNGGLLDLKFVAPRRNRIKVLLFFDVGGSMDPHVRTCEELFSAARSEFKNLEYFYFHNFFYERVWRDNQRRMNSPTPLLELTRTYGRDYKVIVVGDATMSPYEITHPGGSVEHYNEEAGAVWFTRLLKAFPNAVWLNPEAEQAWSYTPSVKLIREMVDQRMYPMTLRGLDDAIKRLRQTGLTATV
ncbi:MAG: VWA domain-containing protein [Gammaproteobacteria bacterium]